MQIDVTERGTVLLDGTTNWPAVRLRSEYQTAVDAIRSLRIVVVLIVDVKNRQAIRKWCLVHPIFMLNLW